MYLQALVESLQALLQAEKDQGGRDKNLAWGREMSCLNLLKDFYFFPKFAGDDIHCNK